MVTLQTMDVLEHKKKGGAEAMINKAKIKTWVEKNRVNLRNPVDPDAFVVSESEVSEETEV